MSSIRKGKVQVRPRYGEVDQMGYVYHANYVTYCHLARTELLREIGIHDKFLEENGVMLPVISMDLRYLKPGKYDELLTIEASIDELPKVRFSFHFKIYNEEGELLCKAKSTVVFADSLTRKPIKIPKFISDALKHLPEPLNI